MKVILLGRYSPHNWEEGVVYLYPSSRTIERNGVSVRLAKLPYKMLLILLVRQGQVVSAREIFDWLYGDREDGGPLTDVVKVYLQTVRDAGLCLGLSIASLYSQGFLVEEFPKGRLQTKTGPIKDKLE